MPIVNQNIDEKKKLGR